MRFFEAWSSWSVRWFISLVSRAHHQCAENAELAQWKSNYFQVGAYIRFPPPLFSFSPSSFRFVSLLCFSLWFYSFIKGYLSAGRLLETSFATSPRTKELHSKLHQPPSYSPSGFSHGATCVVCKSGKLLLRLSSSFSLVNWSARWLVWIVRGKRGYNKPARKLRMKSCKVENDSHAHKHKLCSCCWR